ncbi:MAG: NifU family protein [Chloroflexi bacterium]|nr:NifU family protein [Chloroflexota bacterium]
MPSQGTNSDVPTPPAPSGPRSDPATLEERVTRIIELMRPTIQADGGDLELVDVSEDGDVVVRLHGACVGCPSSTLTLRTGIERNLQVHVPEVRSVRAIE